MIEKIAEFFKKNGRLALLIIFVLELILTIFITPDKFDDSYFIEQVTGTSISSFVSSRYSTWTSRVIIEFVLCFVLKTSKYLWILVEALMVTLAAYSISKIFIKEDKNENNIMLIFMILIYPLDVMASAGWAATTVNYMWPVATCIFSLIPIKKIWNNEKIKPYEYILYSIAIIFAGNQEQSSAILAGTYILFSIFMIIKNKKIHPYMVIQTILAIASLIFILTCSGNYARNAEEIARHFPDIEMYNFFDKIGLGLTSTISLLTAEGNLIYVMLTFLIAVYVFCNCKEKIYKIIAVIPFASSVILKYLLYFTNMVFPYIGSFKELLEQEQVMITASTADNLLYILPLIFALANFICIGLSLWIIFKNLKSNIALLTFLVGLASRLIMGFSPTIWVSGERTMIFLEFAMIIISILIWQEFIKRNDKTDKKIQKRVGNIIKFVGVVQYINVLLCILFVNE